MHARQPGIAAIGLFEKYRCSTWNDDAGYVYNIDAEAGGPWDHCEMAPDESKYGCSWANQRRDFYRDPDTGAWMLRLKERGAGVKCVKFTR